MDEWINASSRGDLDAFQSICNVYGPLVYQKMWQDTADPDYALSLTQKTFLTAWHGISLFQKDEPVSDWIFRIAENCLQGVPRNTTEENCVIPADLDEIIMAPIRNERKRNTPLALLSRMKFTILALIVVVILLLISKTGLLDRRQAATVDQAAKTMTPQISAELLPAQGD